MKIFFILLLNAAFTYSMEQNKSVELLPQGELIFENRVNNYILIDLRTELMGKTLDPNDQNAYINVHNGRVERYILINPLSQCTVPSARIVEKKFGEHTKQIIPVWGKKIAAELFILKEYHILGELHFKKIDGEEFVLYAPNKYVIQRNNNKFEIKNLDN